MSLYADAATIAKAAKLHVVSVRRKAGRENWPSREVPANGCIGLRREYEIAKLPQLVRESVEVYLGLQRLELLKQTPAGLEGWKAGEAWAAEREREKAERRAQHEASLAEWRRLPDSKQVVAGARDAILKACESSLKSGGCKPGEKWSKRGVLSFLGGLRVGQLELDDVLKAAVERNNPSRISYGTLMRWRKARFDREVTGLAPRHRAHNRGQSVVAPTLAGFFEAHIFRTPHIEARALWRLMRARFPGLEIHQTTIGRWLVGWKEVNRSLYEFISNPDRWKQHHRVSLGSASADVERLNQRWELDATACDLLCTDGRYKILGQVEVYSRRPMFLVTPVTGAVEVAALARRGLLEWGPPEEWVLDNGKEYVSEHMVRVAGSLGIELIVCAPFSPEQKPHIESAFKTLSHDLMEIMPGFIGHSVADRKAIEACRSFAERYGTKGATVEMPFTRAELQDVLNRWVSVYESRPHSGLDGQSPAEVVRGWTDPVRRITDERALDVLLFPAPKDGGWRKVSKGCVTVERQKYSAAELWSADVETKDVQVFPDPTNHARVLLYLGNRKTGEKTWLCWAVDLSAPNVPRRELAVKAAATQRGEMRGLRRKLKKEAEELHVSRGWEEVLAHEEAQISKVVDLPRPTQEYTTPALEEAALAHRALTAGPSEEAQAEARAAQDAVVVEMAAHREEPDVFEMNAAEQYRYWCQLERLLRQGGQLGEPARLFFLSFQTSATWRGFRNMEEDLAAGGPTSGP